MKIALDLMGEGAEQIEVICFTVPGPGACITIRTSTDVVELDLPASIYAAVRESIGKSDVFPECSV